MIAMARKYNVRTASQLRKVKAELAGVLQDDSQGAAAVFGTLSQLQGVAPQGVSGLPPSGACTVIRGFQIHAGNRKPIAGLLDAGVQLSLATPVGFTTLTQIQPGEYQALIGRGFSPGQAPQGIYEISGNGGKNVGAFDASFQISSSLVWTNKQAITGVDRTQPLVINWSGGPQAGRVVFGGSGRFGGV